MVKFQTFSVTHIRNLNPKRIKLRCQKLLSELSYHIYDFKSYPDVEL